MDIFQVFINDTVIIVLLAIFIFGGAGDTLSLRMILYK
jgi:hypothetical protein